MTLLQHMSPVRGWYLESQKVRASDAAHTFTPRGIDLKRPLSPLMITGR